MAETKEQRIERARTWLEKAIAAGCDPRIVMPEEQLCTRRPPGGWPKAELLPGPTPMELWDELYALMLPQRRVVRFVNSPAKEGSHD